MTEHNHYSCHQDLARLEKELAEKTAALQQREEEIRELEEVARHCGETHTEQWMKLMPAVGSRKTQREVDELTAKLRAAEEQVKARDAARVEALGILEFMEHEMEDLYDMKEDSDEIARDHLIKDYKVAFDDRCLKCLLLEALKGEAK